MKACHQAEYNVILLKSKDFRDLNQPGYSRASPAHVNSPLVTYKQFHSLKRCLLYDRLQ